MKGNKLWLISGMMTIVFLMLAGGMALGQEETGLDKLVPPGFDTGSITQGSEKGKQIVEIAKSLAQEHPQNSYYYSPNPRLACASYVSAVLMQAGLIYQKFTATEDLWERSGGTIVINKNEPFDSKLLEPGDVIWFGWQPGGFTEHVEIYIGNGETIGTSSKQGVVNISPHGLEDGNKTTLVKRW